MTPTRRRNYQRRFGRAQRTLGALDKGLVRPEQLLKTSEQLQRTVQRLTASPIITVEAPKEQQEPARPKPNIFSRLANASSPAAPPVKKTSVFERMGAFSVQKFKEVETKNQAAIPKPQSSLSAEKVEAKPFVPKVTQVANLQWRPKPPKPVASQKEKEANL